MDRPGVGATLPGVDRARSSASSSSYAREGVVVVVGIEVAHEAGDVVHGRLGVTGVGDGAGAESRQAAQAAEHVGLDACRGLPKRRWRGHPLLLKRTTQDDQRIDLTF